MTLLIKDCGRWLTLTCVAAAIVASQCAVAWVLWIESVSVVRHSNPVAGLAPAVLQTLFAIAAMTGGVDFLRLGTAQPDRTGLAVPVMLAVWLVPGLAPVVALGFGAGPLAAAALQMATIGLGSTVTEVLNHRVESVLLPSSGRAMVRVVARLTCP